MCFRFLQVMTGFLKTGELPHHDHGHVDGLDEVVPVDVHVYAMNDNLHPQDLKHRQLGEDNQGEKTMSALIIFGLLMMLMLTGMPISIALGLTVLTFLFTMTPCRLRRWR